MEIIKKLSEMIEDELEGAEEYVKCAIKHKAEHPTLANVFYDISVQEMHHVTMLHEQVNKIIENHRKEHGEPPAVMKAIWDWEHERQIREAKEIRRYQEMYRES